MEGIALAFQDLIDGNHQALLEDTEPAFTDGSPA